MAYCGVACGRAGGLVYFEGVVNSEGWCMRHKVHYIGWVGEVLHQWGRAHSLVIGSIECRTGSAWLC